MASKFAAETDTPEAFELGINQLGLTKQNAPNITKETNFILEISFGPNCFHEILTQQFNKGIVGINKKRLPFEQPFHVKNNASYLGSALITNFNFIGAVTGTAC